VYPSVMPPSHAVCHKTNHGRLALNRRIHDFPQCVKSCTRNTCSKTEKNPILGTRFYTVWKIVYPPVMQPSNAVCHKTDDGRLALNRRIHDFPQCVKSCIIFVPKNNAKYRKLKLFCVKFSALVPNFNLHYILFVLEK
jgi:hypothetical protein